MFNDAPLNVLYGLHRPYHQPLWMVKWVCLFFAKRSQQKKGCFYVDDVTADFYFVLLDWLSKQYPTMFTNGIPSKEAVGAVCAEMARHKKKDRYDFLKIVLGKQNRIGVEKQIYSTYKAAGYYLNLAIDKLHVVNQAGEITLNCFPSNNRKITSLTINEKNCLVRQILKHDSFFFLVMCLLRKDARRDDLDLETLIYDFMNIYYKVSRYEFISRSLHNYYYVRKSWIEMLGVLTKSDNLSKSLMQSVFNMPDVKCVYDEICVQIKEYRQELLKKRTYNKRKSRFLLVYRKIVKRQEAINDYVNLYDICEEMRMGYRTFNSFLSDFYEQECKHSNILLTNIVATIEPRKRFIVRNIPVIKIKILK